jgi:hypothetical protein
MPAYDYRNCQSLFGYAARVHERSGGACQLCGAGTAEVDFDLWRQLTVEHLIGESQGGYLRQITASLASRFPAMTAAGRADLAAQIDAANTVTACSFCNATTSRDQAPVSMKRLIEQCPDGPPEQVYEHLTAGLAGILAAKRADVAWKLASVRKAFDSDVAPCLAQARTAPELAPATVTSADADTVAVRITTDIAPTPKSFVAAQRRMRHTRSIRRVQSRWRWLQVGWESRRGCSGGRGGLSRIGRRRRRGTEQQGVGGTRYADTPPVPPWIVCWKRWHSAERLWRKFRDQ